MKLKYKNVTVSGLPGAGSSALATSLAKKLNWKYFCGGDFMRKYAIEQGLMDDNGNLHHDATIYDDDFDRQVDFQQRDMVANKNKNILDSWLCGFFAQGIPDVLKVLVICSEDTIRVDRVMNRDNVTVVQAKKHIFTREKKNIEKWSRVYAPEWKKWVVQRGKASKDKPIYFWYPQLYDLVLDTFSLNKQETLHNVLDKLGYKE